MRRIREILLSQYIGAITVGFILAQAVIQFINEIAQAVLSYWVIQQTRESALSGARSFPWTNFIVSMASIALHLLFGFLLIRWLYATEEMQSGDVGGEASGGESEP
jgi:hypothetical protein